jgi:hypothetical protein
MKDKREGGSMNLQAINAMMENAATLQGKHQEQERQHDKKLLIGAGESGGIAPDEPPQLNTLTLQADFIDKTQSKTVDNITISRDTERDTIHIIIELL